MGHERHNTPEHRKDILHLLRHKRTTKQDISNIHSPGRRNTCGDTHKNIRRGTAPPVKGPEHRNHRRKIQDNNENPEICQWNLDKHRIACNRRRDNRDDKRHPKQFSNLPGLYMGHRRMEHPHKTRRNLQAQYIHVRCQYATGNA